MKTKKQRNNHKPQKKKKHKTPRKQIKMKGGYETHNINDYYNEDFNHFINSVIHEEEINKIQLITEKYSNILNTANAHDHNITSVINDLLSTLEQNYGTTNADVNLIKNTMVQLMTPNIFDHYLNFGLQTFFPSSDSTNINVPPPPRTTTNHTEYKSNFYAVPYSNKTGTGTGTETEPYGFNIIQRTNKKDSIFDINGVETLFRVMEELSKDTNAIIKPKYTETYTINERADARPLYPKQQNP